MCTLYRVSGKIRRSYCLEWEGRNEREYGFSCKGKGAVGEVWDVALLDECARQSGATTACWAADLSKFYERIPHYLLLQCAHEQGFNLTIVWLALQAYSGHRRIRVDQAFSREIQVHQGIIAGCAMATTLVKVFMWKILDTARKRFPMIKLKVYLDDLLLQWVGKMGRSRFVNIEKLIEAVKYYAEVIQWEWKSVVNTEKTGLIASEREVSRHLQEELQGMGIPMEGGCRLLGLDYNAGRRQRGMVKGQRMKEGRCRTKRARRLRKAGAASGKLWVTGICPSISYGCEVYGINGHELEKVRKWQGRPRCQEEAGEASRGDSCA